MGSLVIKNGEVALNANFSRTDILIEDGKVKSFESTKNTGFETIDAEGLWVLPGFIDIHTHGANGIDINRASKEELKKLSEFFAMQGVTSYLPTVTTEPREKTCDILSTIADTARSNYVGSRILGIHMEGPFISREFKGAMPEELILDYSEEIFREYERASDNTIKTITAAVESKGIFDLINYANSKDIVVSLGHTGAEYGQCMECIKIGANKVTHIFNAMRPIDHHTPSILEAALESDVYCEAICDGFHLHPAIVRLIVKTKGIDRMIAVSDSIMAAGLPDGQYKIGVSDIVVKNGDARLLNSTTRAGSTLTMIRALKNIVEFTNLPLEECIKMLSVNPAKFLKVDDRKGTIDIGKDADIVIIDKNFNVMYTIIGGCVVYERN